MSAITQNKSGSIITFTGRQVWPMELKVEDIHPLDIAHALSNLCRYNGHVDEFESVAQHSCLLYDRGVQIRCEKLVLKELLLHDGTEAYSGDLVAPLKHLKDFDFYRELEDEIHRKICDRFELPYEFDPIVKELDLAIREAEIRDLKKGIGTTENFPAGEQFKGIVSWSPKIAKSAMIERMRDVGIRI